MSPLAKALCLLRVEVLFHDKEMIQSQSPQLCVRLIESLQCPVDLGLVTR